MFLVARRRSDVSFCSYARLRSRKACCSNRPILQFFDFTRRLRKKKQSVFGKSRLLCIPKHSASFQVTYPSPDEMPEPRKRHRRLFEQIELPAEHMIGQSLSELNIGSSFLFVSIAMQLRLVLEASKQASERAEGERKKIFSICSSSPLYF